MKIQDIILGIFLLVIVIGAFLFAVVSLKNQMGDEIAYNDTDKWRSMLNGTGCKWYQLGCQKLACVVDCQEINKNAGETICVC